MLTKESFWQEKLTIQGLPKTLLDSPSDIEFIGEHLIKPIKSAHMWPVLYNKMVESYHDAVGIIMISKLYKTYNPHVKNKIYIHLDDGSIYNPEHILPDMGINWDNYPYYYPKYLVIYENQLKYVIVDNEVVHKFTKVVSSDNTLAILSSIVYHIYTGDEDINIHCGGENIMRRYDSNMIGGMWVMYDQLRQYL
jgi:hypothetical protein